MPDIDDELDYELITNSRQLGPPPSLRKEAVTVADWQTVSGKAARFIAWELTAADYTEFVESGRSYNSDGSFKRYDNATEEVRFLAATLRDQHGNRIWPKMEDAKAQLGKLGKSSINLLMAAANRMNSAKEAGKAGNSEEIRSAS